MKDQNHLKGGYNMKRQIKSGLLVAGVSLMLAVPAYAYGTAGNGMTGTANTGTGTGTYSGTSTYNGTSTGTYNGLGTNRMNTNDGITNRYGTNNYTGYGTNTINDGRYRTTATTTTRNYDWGWLGLLGLIGLAGMRNRNPEHDRK
jgi:hypothetical protein